MRRAEEHGEFRRPGAPAPDAGVAECAALFRPVLSVSRRNAALALFAALLSGTLAGCGKKNPPRPPPGVPNTYPRTYPSA